MARGNEDDRLHDAVESLRSRLPGRSDAELQAIALEELVRVQVRAIIARSASRCARPASDEAC